MEESAAVPILALPHPPPRRVRERGATERGGVTDHAHRRITRLATGRLVRFEARLVDKSEGESNRARLVIATERMSLHASLPNPNPGALQHLRRGSRLEVTGIVQLMFAPETLLTARQTPGTIEVLLRSPADVVVLHAPSWWTRNRILNLLWGVLGVLFAAVVWVGVLRRQVERQALKITETIRIHRDFELELKGAREERYRLAADLHDSLQQHLTGASYRMEAALMRLGEVPDTVREQFTAARAALERTRTGLRDCLLGLRHVEEGPAEFPALLRHAADGMEHWPKGTVEISTNGDPFPLSRQVMGSLLLFMQEAVGNAFKHGAPTRVQVRLVYDRGSLEMTVEDNGSGFDPQLAPDASSGHFGLESMQHRLRWLGGTTEITSQPGHGTRIVANLLKARES